MSDGPVENEAAPFDAEVDVVETDPDVVAGDDGDSVNEVDDVLLLDEVDNELVLSVWEPTGEPRVDAALELLNTLDVDDVHQHAAVFDEIQQQLRAALTDVDAPGN
jgi:hypothetical protein